MNLRNLKFTDESPTAISQAAAETVVIDTPHWLRDYCEERIDPETRAADVASANEFLRRAA